MNSNLLMYGASVGLLAVISGAVWTLWNQWRLGQAARWIAAQERALLSEKLRLATLQCQFEKDRIEGAWGGLRKFRVAKIQDEGGGIRSFHLAPHDGRPLPPFRPGQYLTVSVTVPGQNRPLVRCYSLSEMPADRDQYRISIKRVPEGAVSSHFHEHVKPGDIVDVKAPAGQFYLDTTRHSPVVFISGGVGITPLFTMLQAQLASGVAREMWFLYSVSNGSEHIWRVELEAIASAHPDVHLVVCYSHPSEADRVAAPRAFHRAGRLDLAALQELLPRNNSEFYLCGPPAMMAAISKGLKDWGVPEAHIHFEAFGAATVQKANNPHPDATTFGLKVNFGRSGKNAGWTPQAGSLLDFAEKLAVPINSGCRAGNCGTCLVALNSGEVTYLREPGVAVEAGSCLACIAVPKTAVSIDA